MKTGGDAVLTRIGGMINLGINSSFACLVVVSLAWMGIEDDGLSAVWEVGKARGIVIMRETEDDR